MEFSQTVNLRRSIRDFSDKKVPFDIVKNSIELGMKAPSHNHLKEWDFILVKDKKTRLALTQTEEMVEKIPQNFVKAFENYDDIAKEMYLEVIPKQKNMLLTAPELLVVVYKPKTKIAESKKIYDLNCLASVWCCIENILLGLAENNVFGVTFVSKNSNAIKEILNIPENLEVATLIPFGYKAEGSKEIRQKNIDVNSRIHINCW
ncbi:MAG: nitroreductase family protein [Fusobacteriaceae bacterium]|nr:nitroreductase family protein [Fusobacteriaceae bacterium]